MNNIIEHITTFPPPMFIYSRVHVIPTAVSLHKLTQRRRSFFSIIYVLMCYFLYCLCVDCLCINDMLQDLGSEGLGESAPEVLHVPSEQVK